MRWYRSETGGHDSRGAQCSPFRRESPRFKPPVGQQSKRLRRVEECRAVVNVAADPIPIRVVVGVQRADVAAVRHAITVCIGVVIEAGTDVAGIAEAVSVAIRLRRVEDVGAVVAEVADAVSVSIRLKEIGDCWAVVAGIAEAVKVAIRLRRVGDVGAVVAGVAQSI